MDIVAASVLRAQQQGYASDLNPEHIAAAIALLFENFTTVFVAPSGPGSLSLEISDEDAIATLSTVWKKLCTAAKENRGFHFARTSSGTARRHGRVHRA
jgi:hypothetical protein